VSAFFQETGIHDPPLEKPPEGSNWGEFGKTTNAGG